MKIHRFIGQFNFNGGKAVVDDKEIVNHINNVLKLRQGEKIILKGEGLGEKLVKITKPARNFIECEIISESENKNEPEAHGILYCAIIKKENFEMVVQKATETGIKEIVPIITKRTVKLNLNEERLQKIAKEAAEQSGRGIVPKIGTIMKFEDAIEAAKNNSCNLFLDSSGQGLKADSYKLDAIGIWIGPEGGWDENEIKLAKENNFEIVSLGKTTLRAETAAIVGSYLISNF